MSRAFLERGGEPRRLRLSTRERNVAESAAVDESPASGATLAKVRKVTPVARALDRIDGVDAFRGCAILSVVLVNNPASWDDIYRPFSHAPWNGLNFADNGAATFLFVVGVSLALALPAGSSAAKVRGAASRGLLLIGVGLLANLLIAIGSPVEGAAPGTPFFERVVHAFVHLRVFGILQRIGLSIVVGAYVSRVASLRTRAVIAVATLLAHGAILHAGTFVLTGSWQVEPATNIAAHLDRMLVGSDHLSALDQGIQDPDGVVSSIGTMFAVVVGTIAGSWLRDASLTRSDALARILVLGSIALWLGSLAAWFIPPNRYVTTPTYSLMVLGITSLTLACFVWARDAGWFPWVLDTFAIAGRHSMALFLACELGGRLLDVVPFGGLPLPGHVLSMAGHLGYSRESASLLYSSTLAILAALLLRTLVTLRRSNRRHAEST